MAGLQPGMDPLRPPVQVSSPGVRFNREITTWMRQFVTKHHFCTAVPSDGDLRMSHMSRDWIQSQHNTRRAGCASLGKSKMRQQYWLRSFDYSLPLLASEYQKICIDSRLDDVCGNAEFDASCLGWTGLWSFT